MEEEIMEYSYKDIIKKPNDLVTSHDATRSGFLVMALEKNRRATPIITEAKALKSIASKLKSPIELLKNKKIYPSLLTASGLSEKSLKHLTDKDKKDAIKNLIENFLEPEGNSFAEELAYRFLLTKGDTLGGVMRNLAGFLGEVKLSRSLISTLEINSYKFYWLDSKSNKWLKYESNDVDIENNLKGLQWENSTNRTLLYNLNIPIVGKNIDLILIDGDVKTKKINSISNKDFIALGELKGGIDPAGADEHWKTANSALDKIRKAFKKVSLKPKTFFIGAAVEKSMSIEIFNQLKKGELNFACNLNIEDQLFSICNWIINL